MIEKDNSKISILIVSRTEKVRRLSIPRWLPRVGISILSLIIIAFSIFIGTMESRHLIQKNKAKKLANLLETLEEENRLKISELEVVKGENEILQSKTLEVEEKLMDLDALQKEVERITGAKPPARGGTNSRSIDMDSLSATESMDVINEVLDNTKLEMANYLDSVQERLDYLNSIPDLMPTYGRLTSRFGSRTDPFNRSIKKHSGIDIANTSGTSIKAAGSGRVIFAGTQASYGRVVIIDHSNGYKSLYAHNSKLLVKVGDVVKKGQQVAKMGSSGRSTGSHLHFEIHKNGIAINPYDVIKY